MITNGQVKLVCDAAYAFDYLAILMVKLSFDTDNRQKQLAVYACTESLIEQMGDQFDEIMMSDEFRALYEANAQTFNLVERVRNQEMISAAEIDKANLLRFEKKRALQTRFFGLPLQETKTSYD